MSFVCLKMDLQVIGAGFGRTGTSSLRDALNLLGFGPCYHMSGKIKELIQKFLKIMILINGCQKRKIGN
jgi:hypothetical protein